MVRPPGRSKRRRARRRNCRLAVLEAPLLAGLLLFSMGASPPHRLVAHRKAPPRPCSGVGLQPTWEVPAREPSHYTRTSQPFDSEKRLMPVDADDWERVWEDLYGNGKPGLVSDVRDIKRVLFKNEDTGSPGLVRDVQDIKEMVTEIRGGWKFVKWAVGLASFALVLIQLADKLGAFRP